MTLLLGGGIESIRRRVQRQAERLGEARRMPISRLFRRALPAVSSLYLRSDTSSRRDQEIHNLTDARLFLAFFNYVHVQKPVALSRGKV